MASKLVNGINFNTIDKEYNLAEVLIDFEDPNIFDIDDIKTTSELSPSLITQRTRLIMNVELLVIINSAYQFNNRIDKLYSLYIRSQLILIVIRKNKSMMPMMQKLEEVYIDFWSLHNPQLQSGGIYTSILIYKHI